MTLYAFNNFFFLFTGQEPVFLRMVSPGFVFFAFKIFSCHVPTSCRLIKQKIILNAGHF